jgi:hypothetical protein
MASSALLAVRRLRHVSRELRHASQRTRRLIVLSTFLGYPATYVGYATLVATNRIPTIVWAPFALLFMAATVFGLFAIYGYSRDRAEMTSRLDERQRQLRDQAWILSYVVLSTVVVAILGGLALWLTFVGQLTFNFGDLSGWFIALGVFLPTLPSAALAWIEPDEPADPDREGNARGEDLRA